MVMMMMMMMMMMVMMMNGHTDGDSGTKRGHKSHTQVQKVHLPTQPQNHFPLNVLTHASLNLFLFVLLSLSKSLYLSSNPSLSIYIYSSQSSSVYSNLFRVILKIFLFLFGHIITNFRYYKDCTNDVEVVVVKN